MKTVRKKIYETPSIQMIGLAQESLICASNPTPKYNNPFNEDGEDW